MVKQKDLVKELFEGLFLHSKPVKMLVSLKSDTVRYATQVSKSVDCTYSHTVKVLDQFRKLGLVQFEKRGRIKIVKLTNDGLDIAHDFEGIRRKFNRLSGAIREMPQEKEVKVKK